MNTACRNLTLTNFGNSMEKAKFLEAKKQVEIIEACEKALHYKAPLIIPIEAVTGVVFSDKQVTRSFLRWVENEKEIAEQKLKEI